MHTANNLWGTLKTRFMAYKCAERSIQPELSFGQTDGWTCQDYTTSNVTDVTLNRSCFPFNGMESTIHQYASASKIPPLAVL